MKEENLTLGRTFKFLFAPNEGSKRRVREVPRGKWDFPLFGENQQKKPNVWDKTICFLLPIEVFKGVSGHEASNGRAIQ